MLPTLDLPCTRHPENLDLLRAGTSNPGCVQAESTGRKRRASRLPWAGWTENEVRCNHSRQGRWARRYLNAFGRDDRLDGCIGGAIVEVKALQSRISRCPQRRRSFDTSCMLLGGRFVLEETREPSLTTIPRLTPPGQPTSWDLSWGILRFWFR